eukprot:144247-Rhodomonas_salina.1
MRMSRGTDEGYDGTVPVVLMRSTLVPGAGERAAPVCARDGGEGGGADPRGGAAASGHGQAERDRWR